MLFRLGKKANLFVDKSLNWEYNAQPKQYYLIIIKASTTRVICLFEVTLSCVVLRSIKAEAEFSEAPIVC